MQGHDRHTKTQTFTNRLFAERAREGEIRFGIIGVISVTIRGFSPLNHFPAQQLR